MLRTRRSWRTGQRSANRSRSHRNSRTSMTAHGQAEGHGRQGWIWWASAAQQHTHVVYSNSCACVAAAGSSAGVQEGRQAGKPWQREPHVAAHKMRHTSRHARRQSKAGPGCRSEGQPWRCRSGRCFRQPPPTTPSSWTCRPPRAVLIASRAPKGPSPCLHGTYSAVMMPFEDALRG